MVITFGNVPHPPYERRIIDNPNGSDPQGLPRSIVGTCVHRMDGTLDGTDSYFRNDLPEALTDYGIGGELDPGKDGAIYMWNDPTGSIVPYANGPLGDVAGNGQAFIDAYNASADPSVINSRLVSIELSGCAGRGVDGSLGCQNLPETPVTSAQFASLCQLIAYWHDQGQVPWDQFPVNPASGVVTQMQHFELAATPCPFPIVQNMATEYQDRVRTIMRSYQEFNAPPPTGNYHKADIVKTNAVLSLRSGPGSSAPIIGTIPADALLVLDGPSAYQDGAWWFQHRGRYGYGWTIDAFTEVTTIQNLSRNSTGDDGPLTGIHAIGGAAISYTQEGHVQVTCPGSPFTGVLYDGISPMSIPAGRGVIAIWDQLGMYGANAHLLAWYTGGTSASMGSPAAGSFPDGAAWERSFSNVLILSKDCNRLAFQIKNLDYTPREFLIDNVYFLAL